MSDHDKTPRNPSARTWTRLGPGALSGLLAGGAALAVAELAAAVRPRSGPVVAVGGAAIDRTPTAVKDWAIRTFGTNDKLVLQLGILAVLTLFALALGAFAVRHRRAGAAGVLVFGIVGAAAAWAGPTPPASRTPSPPSSGRSRERCSCTSSRASCRHHAARRRGSGARAGTGAVS